MIFCLRLKMHTDRASAFHMWLLTAGRRIGVVPTSMTNDSEDMDRVNPDFQIYSFVCQAEAALKPEQLIALFTECRRVRAAVLGIVYQESTEHDDDADSQTGWHSLVRSVEERPPQPVVIRRRRVTPFPGHLRLIWGGLDDDSVEE